jgi:hypothetical protein
LSKLNVGVGADFPVDSAEPSPSEDERSEGCGYRYRHGRHRHHHGFRGRHGWRGGRFFYAGPLALIVFIAMISLAISYPGIILALVAIVAVAFAMRHHHWHDHFDRRGDDWRDRDDEPRDRGGYDGRNRSDAGPPPDTSPGTTTPGRS